MKKAKEYLLENRISPTNENALRILKLVEKHPNYEYFFLKAHFGSEHIPVVEIEKTFQTIQEKNIKISKSVDQYVKYIVRENFEQQIILENGDKKIHTFTKKDDVTKNIRFIYKENRVNVDQRTNFEEFSDEVRDSLTKLAANKIIQQFPAAAKKVVEDLSDSEKKELYFNLNTLVDTNTSFVVKNSFAMIMGEDTPRTVKFNTGKKVSSEDYKQIPQEFRNSLDEIIEKPLQAFIKKSARYKSKDALFSDLNAALYSLSGDEEYKKTVESVEDTDGAILEGLNPDKGIVVASALNAEAYKKIGGDKTNHCIRTQSTFSSYQKFGGKQYLIVNTKLEPTDDYRIIGLTIDGNGKITNAHTKSDANIGSSITNLLLKWGVSQYVNPMSEDEITEMLYFVIEDGSIFNSEDKAQVVIKYLPKLDQTRYDKKKLIHLLRFTRSESEMKSIIKMSLDMRNSEEFLLNYDYLANTILKVVSDDKQAHEMVLSFVRSYNESVGLSKEDCMNMLLNKSKYVQPNRLIEIIGKSKFNEFVASYSWEQEEQILKALPQLFIYFLRDKQTNGKEILLILDSLYLYEKRPDIRKLVLKKMLDSGSLKKISRNQLQDLSILVKIEEDDDKIAKAIPTVEVA